MANIKSAKKRILVINKKTARNKRVKGHVKATLRNFEIALAEGNMDVAAQKFQSVEKEMMQAAAKGTLNKKAVSRKVSRLAKRLNAAKAV